jgi:hypothetical protein
VDDLCKKAASLWAGREMLGIMTVMQTDVGAATWANIVHGL